MEKWKNDLTLEEKSELLVQGLIEQWDKNKYGMKRFLVSDGASGVRREREDGQAKPAPVCYPSPSIYACSWDRKLIHKTGKYLGIEAKARGVDILFGPGCNIKRSPLCGRNFEYYSEDPCLTAELATEFVKGLQEQGTGACVKHFAANNQETRRMSIDEKISLRALREIYLRAFEKPVREGKPDMVMTAYNKVNGEYCADSEFLLKKVLREEWNYDGNIITDCVAAHDLAKGIKNGLNLQLSSESRESIRKEVRSLIEKNEIREEEIDRAIESTIHLGKKCLQRDCDISYDAAEHHEFARHLAEESLVLLKNEQKFLPLQANERICVIGDLACSLRYQGGGSNHIENLYKVEQVYDAVRQICRDAVFAKGYGDKKEEEEELWKEAVEAAKGCDKVVICIGLPDAYESEGYDREHLEIPSVQEQLLYHVLEANPNVAVVLFHGAPLQMRWSENVKAVLDAGLPGEAGGRAVADCLFGNINPSGKLAETVPLKLADTPCYLNFPGGMNTVEYAEGIYIGYRYYDKKEMQVSFPFGHGLSYTSFQYSGIKVRDAGNKFEVSFWIENTGCRSGKEIMQLYICKPSVYYDCPVRELQDFTKAELEPKEKKQIHFLIAKDAFKIYGEEVQEWITEGGTGKIEIGASSRDIRLSAEVRIKKEEQLPLITGHTVLKDIFERYGKRDVLGELFRKYHLSGHHLNACDGEDPTLRAMAVMNTLESLKWADPNLTDGIIDQILIELNT